MHDREFRWSDCSNGMFFTVYFRNGKYFLCNFNSLAHMDKIIFRLTKLFANSLKPDLMLCESALLFVQIHYLTIRIHAALKFHRQSESTTQKPQRKLLKILHL